MIGTNIDFTQWMQTRKEYIRDHLAIEDVNDDPLDQLKSWLSDAVKSGVEEPNAMVLGTVDPGGQPDARVVLLKGLDHGLIFFTNYQSKKGGDLEHTPKACVNFFWPGLERQVRVAGITEKIDREHSCEYFDSRPKGSQISATVSPQSQVIESKEWLAAEHQKAQARQEKITCPDTWGGYRLKPHLFEFWQGCRDRLHDRICFQVKDDGSWHIFRKAP